MRELSSSGVEADPVHNLVSLLAFGGERVIRRQVFFALSVHEIAFTTSR